MAKFKAFPAECRQCFVNRCIGYNLNCFLSQFYIQWRYSWQCEPFLELLALNLHVTFGPGSVDRRVGVFLL
jgi:hypothetical protein